MIQLFEGRKVVLLTKHKKEKVIKPLMEKETGCEVLVEKSFDTDTFGTFARDIARTKSQMETAKLKILKGMELTRTDIGIASEGSFGSHPFLPIPWNIELVLLYDKKENFEIYGVSESGETNMDHLETDSFDEVKVFADKIGFPEHFLIIRPDSSDSEHIIKGINHFDWLEKAYEECMAISKTGKVFLETDMRAHANPTRMNNIKKATEDLIEKLKNLCPNCQAPGFIASDKEKGLPCELCGLPTNLVKKYISVCHKCKFKNEELYPNGTTASAQYCNHCNP